MKFAVGDLVVQKDVIRPDSSYNIQKVVHILDEALIVEHYGYGYDGEVHIDRYDSEPGTRSWREAFQRLQVGEVFSLKEAEEERQRLLVAKSKLGEEFDAVRDQLEAKLNQAAKLVNEAGEIAKTHDKTFYDLREECMVLFGALKNGGWSHSHMSC